MKVTPSKSVTKKNKVVKSGVTSTKKSTRPSSTAKKSVKAGVTSKKPTRPSSTAKKAVKRRVSSKRSTIPSYIAKKAVKKGSGFPLDKTRGNNERARMEHIAKTGKRGSKKQNFILRNIPGSKWKRKHKQDEEGIKTFNDEALKERQKLQRKGVDAFADGFNITEYREKQQQLKKSSATDDASSTYPAPLAPSPLRLSHSHPLPPPPSPPSLRHGTPMPGMTMPGMPMQGMPMQGMPMQGMPGMPMQGRIPGGKSRSQTRGHNNAKKRKTRS
jgi:hypothetical protein